MPTITTSKVLCLHGGLGTGKVTIPPGMMGPEPIEADALIWTDGQNTYAFPVDDEDKVALVNEILDRLSDEAKDAVKKHLHGGVVVAHEMPR